MADAVTIAMCQINIAIGFVYIGLREFRYKQNPTDAIWNSFCSIGCDAMDLSSSQYTALTRDDQKFSKNHHYITGWASQLLLDRLSEKWKNILSSSSANSNLSWLNRAFTWYNSGFDKRVTFLMLVVLPMLLLWINASISDTKVFLIAGQGLVALQVLAAWCTAKLVGRRIREKGGYMMAQLDVAAVEQQVAQVRTTAQPESF